MVENRFNEGHPRKDKLSDTTRREDGFIIPSREDGFIIPSREENCINDYESFMSRFKKSPFYKKGILEALGDEIPGFSRFFFELTPPSPLSVKVTYSDGSVRNYSGSQLNVDSSGGFYVPPVDKPSNLDEIKLK